MTKNFHGNYDDDLNELCGDSELCMGIGSEIFREEEVFVVKHISYSGIKPKERKVTRKVEPVSAPGKRRFDYANHIITKVQEAEGECIALFYWPIDSLYFVLRALFLSLFKTYLMKKYQYK